MSTQQYSHCLSAAPWLSSLYYFKSLKSEPSFLLPTAKILILDGATCFYSPSAAVVTSAASMGTCPFF